MTSIDPINFYLNQPKNLSTLPLDTLHIIFKFLNPTDLTACRRNCRSWKYFVGSSSFFSKIIHRAEGRGSRILQDHANIIYLHLSNHQEQRIDYFLITAKAIFHSHPTYANGLLEKALEISKNLSLTELWKTEKTPLDPKRYISSFETLYRLRGVTSDSRSSQFALEVLKNWHQALYLLAKLKVLNPKTDITDEEAFNHLNEAAKDHRFKQKATYLQAVLKAEMRTTQMTTEEAWKIFAPFKDDESRIYQVLLHINDPDFEELEGDVLYAIVASIDLPKAKLCQALLSYQNRTQIINQTQALKLFLNVIKDPRALAHDQSTAQLFSVLIQKELDLTGKSDEIYHILKDIENNKQSLDYISIKAKFYRGLIDLNEPTNKIKDLQTFNLFRDVANHETTSDVMRTAAKYYIATLHFSYRVDHYNDEFIFSLFDEVSNSEDAFSKDAGLSQLCKARMRFDNRTNSITQDQAFRLFVEVFDNFNLKEIDRLEALYFAAIMRVGNKTDEISYEEALNNFELIAYHPHSPIQLQTSCKLYIATMEYHRVTSRYSDHEIFQLLEEVAHAEQAESSIQARAFLYMGVMRYDQRTQRITDQEASEFLKATIRSKKAIAEDINNARLYHAKFGHFRRIKKTSSAHELFKRMIKRRSSSR